MLTWLEPYWLSAVSIAATAVGLGFLLFIHEFGHFFVAKRSGVKVEVFSLGICHFLFSWTWKGTVYALSWLPLGGYVRMAGQQDLAPPPGHKPLPHEYGAKKPVVRMAIIVAGVTMNFIAGYFCFAAAFYGGRDSIVPVVDGMRRDLPSYKRAYDQGLRDGDRVLAVNGDPVYSFPGMKMRVARIKPGTDVTFRVRHAQEVAGHPREEDIVIRTFEGAGRGLSMTPIAPSMEYTPTTKAPLSLGFGGENRLMITPLPKVLAKFPEWDEVFDAGDSIVSVNGEPCSSPEDFSRAVEKAFAPPATTLAPSEPSADDGSTETGKQPETNTPKEMETPTSSAVQDETTAAKPASPEEPRSITVTVRKLDKSQHDVQMPVKSVYRMGIAFAKGGDKADKPLRVIWIDKDSVAGKQGIDLGDELFLDDGLKPCSFEDFAKAVQAAKDTPLKVVARSAYDGVVHRDIELRAKRYWQPALSKDDRVLPWGSTLLVTRVESGSQAEAKGLRQGSVIIGISTQVDKRKPLQVDATAPATLEWVSRGREHGPHRVMPFPGGPTIEWEIPQMEWLQFGVKDSLVAGWRETRESLLSTTVVLKKLSNREIGADVVSGPVGIVHVAYKMAQEGIGQLLWLLGLMGVSLAFFNLLPIPILDGGHLVFLVYEAVFRRPPSPRVVEIAQYAGLLIIGSLFVLVFWNDIARLIRVG